MDWLDKKSPVPGGGKAASGGRFYHLSFRSGSRASGACARASHDYIAREGEYANVDRDPAIHTESDHMAAMLGASVQRKRPSDSDDLSLQVALVAGACNQRYLQLWSGAA
jgi:hypothetical protein